jgi:hypothetical protein
MKPQAESFFVPTLKGSAIAKKGFRKNDPNQTALLNNCFLSCKKTGGIEYVGQES